MVVGQESFLASQFPVPSVIEVQLLRLFGAKVGFGVVIRSRVSRDVGGFEGSSGECNFVKFSGLATINSLHALQVSDGVSVIPRNSFMLC